MQKVEIELEDDLTGGRADETVRFGVDGATYELDLSAKHADDLRRRLAPFVEHARIYRPHGSRSSARSTASRERSHQIRAWAVDQGLDIADHGRLPADIVRQYESSLSSTRGAASSLDGRPAAKSGRSRGAARRSATHKSG